uniref:Serpentine receptor class gamma n=1 Tax=Caenorhabditis tropicalis TaxID=1561998 RepID=A0A1I7T6K5_9PELO
MVLYGFTVYMVPPSREINWTSMTGMGVTGGIVTFSLITTIYFAVKTYKAIQRYSSISTNLSSLSKALQTQFFYSLVIQTITPVILIHIPSTLLVVNACFSTGAEVYGKLIATTVSIFPVVDPLPSMIIIKPYRQAIRSYIPFTKPVSSINQNSHMFVSG